ncbi:hypothetical protein FACS1894145_6270 [Bacteroidia bacterium]|nr:hypothetical protein FACS189446_2640 [Bacteroidia bacterium]GHU80242.1 hypothetical protein FACS1894145_6270 [Bacteroidia bacterium]
MATISLKYNSRNIVAQKTIDYILSLGVFEKTERSVSQRSPFAESDDDIKKGRVYSADNADDLIAQCLK